MKILCMSDTHNYFPDLESYKNHELDVIIHCGDFTESGTAKETYEFLNWYSSLSIPYKLFIGGNHDFFCEGYEIEIKKYCQKNGLIYLRDSGFELNGVNFWGSPYVSHCPGWAFAKTTNEVLRYWKLIPKETNILITHTPPAKVGLLSKLKGKLDLGCIHLKQIINEVKPSYHVFGHIHEGHGIHKNEFTCFINCSISNNSQKINPPFMFTV